MHKLKYIILLSVFIILIIYGRYGNTEGRGDNDDYTAVNLSRRIENIHTETINDIEYDPVNNYFITSSNDDTVGIFDFNTGENIGYIYEYYSDVRDSAFNRNYNLLATADDDGYIMIFKYPERIILKTMLAHHDSVRSLCFTYDNENLLSAGDDGLIKIWNIKGNDFGVKRIIEAHDDFITKISTDRASKYILTSSEDNTIKLFDMNTGSELYNLKGHIDYVRGSDISPDGHYAVSGDDSGEIIVWDLNYGVAKYRITHHKDFIRDITISPDGKTFIVACDDKTVTQWDIETGDMLKIYTGFDDWIYDCVVTNNRDYIIAVDDSFSAYILPLSEASIKDAYINPNFIPAGYINDKHHKSEIKLKYMKKTLPSYSVNNLTATQKGDMLTAFTTNGNIDIWNIETSGEPVFLKRVKSHSSNIIASDISKNDKYIATSSFDSGIRICYISGTIYRKLNNKVAVNNLKITPNSKLLVISDLDKRLIIWDIENGKQVKAYQMPSIINSIDFNEDGSKIIISYTNNKAVLYSFPDLNLIKVFKTNSPVKKSIISSNYITVSTMNSELMFFNKYTYELEDSIKLKVPVEYMMYIKSENDTKFLITNDIKDFLIIWKYTGNSFEPIEKITGSTCFTIQKDKRNGSIRLYNGNNEGVIKTYEIID